VFDIGRYLGFWYEVARLPNWFEPEGSFSSAEYGLSSDGKITVKNTSYNPLWVPFAQQTGVAIPIQSQSFPLKPTLGVSFFPGAWGEYRIELLFPNYDVAVVGNSAKSQLWVLSRSRIPRATLSLIYAQLLNLGYDITRIQVNPTLVG